jgi:hypothetical protein
MACLHHGTQAGAKHQTAPITFTPVNLKELLCYEAQALRAEK